MTVKTMTIFDPKVSFRNGLMAVMKDDNVTVSEIITTSDTKQFFTTAINTYFMQDDPNDDRQWEQIYRVVPGTGHGNLFPFRPVDVVVTASASSTDITGANSLSVGSHGIVFNEVGEGGEIRFSRIVSAEKYVKHIKYGTALGYSNEWFSDGEMALIEMVTEDFRRAAADKLAAIHYGAIVAAVNAGISASSALHATGTSGVARLINSLNAVGTAMRRAHRAPSIILAAPEQEQILELAFRYVPSGGTPTVVQNETTARMKRIYTEYIAAGTIYLIEPKRRLISTNRLPLSLGNFSDLLHDSEVLVGKFRRGVLIGEGAAIQAITGVPSTIVGAANDV